MVILDTKDINHPYSSVHEVMNNDDLLIEILLRLPVISLVLFKSVCKRWVSLITNPSFTLRLSKIANLDPPSGLFLQQPESSFAHDFVPLDIRLLPYKTTLSFGSDLGNVEILQSCNGLLLCCINSDDANKYYVYNPTIKRFKLLLKVCYEKPSRLIISMTMAFDPVKSPHYKVVCFGFSQVYTYSSETCKWNFCAGQFYNLSVLASLCSGIYWKDAIHWLDDSMTKVIHFRLDVDPSYLTSTQFPQTLDGIGNCYHKLFESRTCLLLIRMVCLNNLQPLVIYEMRTMDSGWLVKYVVNLDNIMMIVPKTSWKLFAKHFPFDVMCIVVGENEENSFLVMELFGEVVKYNIMLETVCRLFDLGAVRMRRHELFSFPFIASFAGV